LCAHEPRNREEYSSFTAAQAQQNTQKTSKCHGYWKQEQRFVGDAKIEVTSEKSEAGAGACAGAAATDALGNGATDALGNGDGCLLNGGFKRAW
jgi:hypothetical protein